MMKAILSSLGLSVVLLIQPAFANDLVLILTDPELAHVPQGYEVIKTLSATATVPDRVGGPLDNPALKNIMVQAENINADALLGLSCLTNGRAIQCESQALKHDFSMPDQNTEEDTLNLLFGSRFYENPADIPAHAGVGNSISVTFYVLKPSLRWVGGESVQNSKKWWGLQQKSVTLVKPTIPALCIDSLAFIAAQIKPNQGVVNFNCYASTSALAGYVQVNAEANALNLPLEPQK